MRPKRPMGGDASTGSGSNTNNGEVEGGCSTGGGAAGTVARSRCSASSACAAGG